MVITKLSKENVFVIKSFEQEDVRIKQVPKAVFINKETLSEGRKERGKDGEREGGKDGRKARVSVG